MSPRGIVLSISLLLVSLISTGCQQAQQTGSGSMVQIGTTKADLLGMPAEYRAIHPRLEDIFQSEVVFRSQPNGKAIGQQLEQGFISYGILTAQEYCTLENPSKLTMVASALNQMGKPSRKAYIITKANCHVKTIQDCALKRFAFGTYKDLLTDKAAQKKLEQSGVPVKKILPEILPPPLSFEGRLYRQHDVALTIANDLTVNAGVVDEIDFAAMPEKGGNIITGPSKDQFKIMGETFEVPELLVVAGPKADPKQTEKLKAFLIDNVKDNELVCKQLGVKGFTQADRAAYDVVCGIMSNGGNPSQKTAMSAQ